MYKNKLTFREEIIALAEQSQLPSKIEIQSFGEASGVTATIFHQRVAAKFYDITNHFNCDPLTGTEQVNIENMLMLLKKHRTTTFDNYPILPGFLEDRIVENNKGLTHVALEDFVDYVDIMPFQIISRIAKNEWKISEHIIIDFDKNIDCNFSNIYVNLNELQSWAQSFTTTLEEMMTI